MIQFSHAIADPEGLHARPIAAIAAKLAPLSSAVTIRVGERSSEARDLMGMLGLGARGGSTIEVTIEGPDEEQAAEALRAVLP